MSYSEAKMTLTNVKITSMETHAPKEALSWEEAKNQVARGVNLRRFLTNDDDNCKDWKDLETHFSPSMRIPYLEEAALLFRSSLEAENKSLKEETTLLRERLEAADELVMMLDNLAVISIQSDLADLKKLKAGIEKYQSLKPKDDEQQTN